MGGGYFFIPVVAPCVGALLAGCLTKLMRSPAVIGRRRRWGRCRRHWRAGRGECRESDVYALRLFFTF